MSLALAACGDRAGSSPPPPVVATPTETVLYPFAGGTDGAHPAGLVLGADGNLYGITVNGGTSNDGTVFKITPAGTESVLYSFAGGMDGTYPAGLVLGASGNLYGTTNGGGASNDGTVFKITPAGTESVLYSFAGGTDGAHPGAGLVLGANGDLYGTTIVGGASNDGTVFRITSAGTESVLYSFAGGTDGAHPRAGLVMDASGNLYGTTNKGGTSNDGTVFKITPAGTKSVLHSFAGGTDGAHPYAGLVLGANGDLYGTTNGGETSGLGTVFKITPDGTESVLHSFNLSPGERTDGAFPASRLVLGAGGNLYGTTIAGGASGRGTVFKITPAGIETVLYSFTTDGNEPIGLVLGAGGDLYGITVNGGASGHGTVFKITH